MDRQLNQVKRGSRSTYDYVFVWKRKREEDNWESQEGGKVPPGGRNRFCRYCIAQYGNTAGATL